MSEAISKSRNGQRTINKEQTPPTTTTRTASPIKYFIPLSPQSTMSTNNFGGSGGFLSNEISMRKQTLLRRMWSREFQHTKYSGSWSPPLRRSTHQPQSRLQKFNTVPEIISASCEKCRELGVLTRTFDEELCESKEDKSQQTDFDLEGNSIKAKGTLKSSPSSGASTVIHSADVNKLVNNSANIDSNGNNIIICMTALQDPPRLDNDVLRVEIDGNNNANEKYLRKQFSQQLDDHELTYTRLREDNLEETEIDEYISQMLIDNLNNVIKTVNENLQANGERNLVKIDYHPTTGEGEENGYDNKFEKQHEISIQMRNNDGNGDNENTRNSSPAVVHGSCEESNESPEIRQQNFYGYYGKNLRLCYFKP